MTEFRSWKSYRDFEQAVKGFRTYDEYKRCASCGGRSLWEIKSFLDAVGSTADRRPMVYEGGAHFWRAQRGCDPSKGQAQAYTKGRMMPLQSPAYAGRVNPEEWPVLYLATDRHTAITEVRPEAGSYVSVALFKSRQDLKLVNCISSCGVVPDDDTMDEPPANRREDYVWAMIDDAFSRPVALDDKAEYVPTQIIAGFLKEGGWHGIQYRSWLRDGVSVALFDLQAAKVVSPIRLFKVVGIEYSAHEADLTIWGTLHKKLLDLYAEKCAVTACGPPELLKTTHIWPFAGPELDNPDNGLLLRVDIQRLFDAGLLRIHPDTLRIHIDERRLRDTDYWHLDGQLLQERVDGLRPGREYLQKKWDWVEKIESELRAKTT